MSINLRFPFRETNEGGVFGTNKTTQQAIRDNLLAFLTLRKGQRPMNNKLYSPLYDFIFQQFDDIAEDELREALIEKLSNYFPEINVVQIRIEFVELTNLVKITLVYELNDLGSIQDSVSVNLPIEEQTEHDHNHQH